MPKISPQPQPQLIEQTQSTEPAPALDPRAAIRKCLDSAIMLAREAKILADQLEYQHLPAHLGKAEHGHLHRTFAILRDFHFAIRQSDIATSDEVRTLFGLAVVSVNPKGF
jgi:hypothetical protein